MLSILRSVSLVAVALTFIGCSSAELKQRQEQRDRVVQNSKLYCEFVNGDNYPDIDVAINLAMGAKCDSEKSMSMTNYRTPSEINGVLFCCGTRDPKELSRRDAKPERSLVVEPIPVLAPAPLKKAPEVVEPMATPTPTPTPTPAPQVTATPIPTVNVTPTGRVPNSRSKPNITFEGSSDLDE